jgi:hypothetical protein
MKVKIKMFRSHCKNQKNKRNSKYIKGWNSSKTAACVRYPADGIGQKLVPSSIVLLTNVLKYQLKTSMWQSNLTKIKDQNRPKNKAKN